MKFFCNAEFIRKVLIVILLSIIILLLLMGRFRTMRIKILGLEEGGHTSSIGIASAGQRKVLKLYYRASLWG